MIEDVRVLRDEFVPCEVKHHDREVIHLASMLMPITDGRPADTAFITGPMGRRYWRRCLPARIHDLLMILVGARRRRACANLEHGQFREMVLMGAVYTMKSAIKS